MAYCSHGRQIYCDWHECPQCCEEEERRFEHQERMDALNRIANNTGRVSAVEDENRRLREEIERLKRSR